MPEEFDEKQLSNNQKFIDLIHAYEDLYEDEPELMHAKGLVKFILNKGYKLVERENYVL